MSKIKVAYLIDTICSLTAGTEKQLLGIINRLDKDRFDPCLICLYKSPWMMTHNLPLKVFDLGYKGFITPGFYKVMKRFSNILEQERFDVVQTFFEDSIFVCYLGAKLSKWKPILLSSRRDLGLGDEEPWYHRIFNLLLPFVDSYFDGIIVNGESVKEYVIRKDKVHPSRIKVIHNGISIPIKNGKLPAVIRENPADIWIGVVANLKPVKRLDVFVRAFAQIIEQIKHQSLKAVILGEGSERIKLEKMVQGLNLSNDLYLTGSVDNVQDYLQNIDIGVLCSDREGFPNAILEYMSCGLPVVSTTTGGCKELVEDGVNGLCVPPGQADSLAAALQELCISKEMRLNMGRRSREKVEDRFEWQRIIDEWREYYCSLIR